MYELLDPVAICPSKCVPLCSVVFTSSITALCMQHTACKDVVCGSLVWFFFQAEDGIRDLTVTGVQTCALPISGLAARRVLSNCRRGNRSRLPVVNGPRRPHHRAMVVRPEPSGRTHGAGCRPGADRKSVV